MRTNGLLYIETRGEAAVDEYGEVTECAASWSEEPLECLLYPTADNRLGRYEDGEFRQASYVVLVEGVTFDADRIRLVRTISEEEELGEFRIISIRPLPTGDRTQIIV